MKNTIKEIILLIILLLLLSISAFSQNTKPKNNLEGFDNGNFTEDTILNQFIIKWLGKPYKLGGKTEKGIDCSQFNKRLYLDVYKLELENVCYKQWNQTERIKKDSLQVGDLVFFRSKASPSGWHCGCYIGNTYFVHSANRYEGVKVSSLIEPRYNKNFKGGGRIN